MQNNFKIRADNDGVKITKWFKKSGIKIPFALFQKLLRKGAVKVNGKKVKGEYELKTGDEVQLPTKLEDNESNGKRIIRTSQRDADELLIDNIIYENEEIIAINKPQGLPTQGGSKVNLSVDALLDYLRFGNEERPKLIHRLDKDTSGILLLARTSAAAAKYAAAFKKRDFEKTYIALVVGDLPYEKGEIDAPLLEKALVGKSEKTVVDFDNGKNAKTTYKVLKASKEVSLLEVKITTGRKHQIRVHLAHIGNPIVGDGKYGGRLAFVEDYADSLHLHAYKISHPEINFAKKITAPLNINLTKALKKLRISID